MARSKHRDAAREPAPPPERVAASRLAPWHWRTFPVFFAFSVGALIMAVLNGAPSNTIAAAAQVTALLAVSFGLARIVVRKFFAERRERRMSAGDDAYEDVVVYPDAPKKR